MNVYLNGSFKSFEEAAIPVNDRGFLFGDGIYEVIRAVGGNLFRTGPHLERLREGLDGLGIRLDSSELERLPQIGRELLESNGLLTGEATVYIQVTRGAAWPRAHTYPDPPPKPTVFLYAAPFEPHFDLHEQGVAAITHPDLRWARCNLKTVNLLANSMARQRAVEAGANSAIMIRDGMITESPNANIFAVREGALYTYPLSCYILNGITRQLVLEKAAALGIPVRTLPVRQEELAQVEELFFSGTTTDIQPVVEIDGRPVGSGKPGPVTRRIQKAFREELYGSEDGPG